MRSQRDPTQRFSLWRWSRRKLEAKAAAPAAVAPGLPPAPPAASAAAAAPAPLELPPVASLTFESDFAAFLRPEVDDQLRRAALKQLFRDPRFNVMDGLDTYIDDYTQADPIAADVLADLLQRGFDRAGPAPTTASPPEPGAAAAASSQPAPGDPREPGGSEDASQQHRAEQAQDTPAGDESPQRKNA